MGKKILIFLIVFFSSWTSAFGFEFITWISIPLLLSIFSFFLFLLHVVLKLINREKILIDKIDIYLFIFLVWILGISLINSNSKTLNYAIAYLVTFLFSYWANKNLILNYISLKKLLDINLFTMVFVSVFGISDFILQFFYEYRIQDFFPRNVIISSEFGELKFPRNTGFTEEPTYFAWYYICLGLFSIYHLLKKEINVIFKILLVTLIFTSFLITFSTAGITILVFVSLLGTLLYSKKRKYLIFLAPIFIYALFSLSKVDSEVNILLPMIEKLSGEGASGEDRSGNLYDGINELIQNPFLGNGLGYYSSIGRQSFINYYLFLATEAGVITSLFFIVFLCLIFIKILDYNGSSKFVMLISFCAGSAHLFTQSSFYQPYFWLMIIFIFKFIKEEQSIKLSGYKTK